MSDGHTLTHGWTNKQRVVSGDCVAVWVSLLATECVNTIDDFTGHRIDLKTRRRLQDIIDVAILLMAICRFAGLPYDAHVRTWISTNIIVVPVLIR